MLQINHIRENKDEVIKKLAKKNFDANAIIHELLEADQRKRNVQVTLEQVLAESNKLAKDIGELMKSGEKAKAEILKMKTVSLKESSKELAEKLEVFTNELTQKLYTLPNLPADLVPVGKTPEENLNIFQEEM